MLERLKYTLKFFFVSPKPKVEETEYRSERKSFSIDYGKYYTKKEKFTQIMWSITLLTFTGEVGFYSFFLYQDSMRWLFIGLLILFLILDIKNNNKIREKYKKRAIEEGEYGK